MTNKTHEVIKDLSGYVYHNGKTKLPAGAKLLHKSEDLGSGFYAETYVYDGKIIIIYRGTDIEIGKKELAKDFYNNLQMALATRPRQLHNAESYYYNIKKKYPNKKIIIGGHSLGGSLAQILGSCIEGLEAVTFNAFGTGSIKLKRYEVKYPENVTNYGHQCDRIFKINENGQIGKTFIIKDSMDNRTHFRKYHGVENLDLSKAIEYKPNTENRVTSPLRPADKLRARLESEWAQRTQSKKEANERFEKNIKHLSSFRNKYTKSDKIFTQDEIDRMSSKERKSHSLAIEYQKNSIGIPTEKQAKKAVSAGGMVYVSAYVRSDGVRVESYYRSRPA